MHAHTDTSYSKYIKCYDKMTNTNIYIYNAYVINTYSEYCGNNRKYEKCFLIADLNTKYWNSPLFAFV